MQTLGLQRCVTATIRHSLDFVAMKKPRARGERIPAKPLKKWLENQSRGAKADFCRELGIGAALLTNWLARGILPADRLRATAAAMSITESEYRVRAGIQEERHPTKDTTSYERSEDSSIVKVDRLKAIGSMGTGLDQPDDDHVMERIELPASWVRSEIRPLSSPFNLRIIEAYGDSMEPTLKHGDLVLVDTGRKSADVDGIYVLRANKRLYIKRVRQRIDDGRYEVKSDNPRDGHPIDLDGRNTIEILGKVVWAWNGRKL